MGFVLFVLVVWGLIYIAMKVQESAKAEEEARKEIEFQEKHPELWQQRELLKLAKERLAAEKELAEDTAKRENLRNNVGLGFQIGRAMRWW